MDPSLEKAEDLLADATALVQRAKLELPPENDPVVFGFRNNGALSLFFDPEVAYHFNEQHQLRRVFLHGERYKAEQGRLVCVTRIPGLRNVRLESTPIKPPQLKHILSVLDEQLRDLEALLKDGNYRIIGQVSPSGNNIVERLQNCIPEMMRHQIALSPHADVSDA
ncbi:MAG: hypothetical protein VX970_05820 [Planctomycetota bacterium]|nr:hypothetical protein [Planctomycetota bacterium]